MDFAIKMTFFDSCSKYGTAIGVSFHLRAYPSEECKISLKNGGDTLISKQ